MQLVLITFICLAILFLPTLVINIVTVMDSLTNNIGSKDVIETYMDFYVVEKEVMVQEKDVAGRVKKTYYLTIGSDKNNAEYIIETTEEIFDEVELFKKYTFYLSQDYVVRSIARKFKVG